MSVVTRLESMGRRVRTRSEWGTRYESLYQSRREDKPFTLPADYLFAHISVTRDDGPSTPEFDADMRELERIGYERFRSGISYNWAIDAITGEIGEGQPLDAKGTHTVNDKNVPGFPTNLNLYGHAVVMIGMPGVKPTVEFVKSFAAIRTAEIAEGVLVENAAIYPHSKFAAKECPTAAVIELLPNITALSNAPISTTPEKDWLDMATQAEVQAAFLGALRAYGSALFKDESGTADSIWDEVRADRELRTAQHTELVAAIKDLTAAIKAGQS